MTSIRDQILMAKDHPEAVRIMEQAIRDQSGRGRKASSDTVQKWQAAVQLVMERNWKEFAK